MAWRVSPAIIEWIIEKSAAGSWHVPTLSFENVWRLVVFFYFPPVEMLIPVLTWDSLGISCLCESCRHCKRIFLGGDTYSLKVSDLCKEYIFENVIHALWNSSSISRVKDAPASNGHIANSAVRRYWCRYFCTYWLSFRDDLRSYTLPNMRNVWEIILVYKVLLGYKVFCLYYGKR